MNAQEGFIMKFTTLFAGIAFVFTTSLVMAAGQAPAPVEPGCCAAAAAHVVTQDHVHGGATTGCCDAKDAGCAMCAKGEGKAGCAEGGCAHKAGDAAKAGCCDTAGDTAKAGCCDKAASGDAKACGDKAAPKH